MEFVRSNYIDTTTSILVGSNTITVANILNWDKTFQYTTENFANDLTTASITFNFDSTQTLSRIAIMEHNLKGFTVFYDGATANTFGLSSGATTVSDFASNSETSQILRFNQINCTSVTIDMKSTQVANKEKAVGYILLSHLGLSFSREPSAKNYKPVYTPEEVVHKLSDGGHRVHVTGEKFSASVKYQHITKSFRDSLRFYNQTNGSFVFIESPTHTAWNEVIHEVVWPGKFEFFKYSDNAVEAGYSGTINLREIS